MDDRTPVSEALGHLDMPALDEGEQVEFAFILMKTTLDDEVGWSFRTTGPPNHEELLGALIVQVDLLKRTMLSQWDA